MFTKFTKKDILNVILVIGLASVSVAVLSRLANIPQGETEGETPTSMTKLEVEVISPIRSIVNPSTEVTVVSNHKLELKPHNRVEFKLVGEVDGTYFYVAKITAEAQEVTKVTLILFDEFERKFEQKVEITREPFALPPGFTEVAAWEDSKYSLDTDNWQIKIDKQNRLFEDYEPDDLVDLNQTYGIFTLNNAELRAEAAIALKAMLDDLTKDTGEFVTVASGYRSYENQVQTYAFWIQELGLVKANEVSAKPGHSQHQLGTTVDFVNEDTNWQISNKFGKTTAGKWLQKHAAEYGYSVPYSQDQSEEGGYKEESWHYRYVGIQEE